MNERQTNQAGNRYTYVELYIDNETPRRYFLPDNADESLKRTFRS